MLIIMLQILADENMPYVDELFGSIGTVRKMAGRDIAPQDLHDVDMLLVRSITKVDQHLLSQASRLKFVGSATIGTDHLDIDYLESHNIAWGNAPGCNATAVAEYVISALTSLANRHKMNLAHKRVAIVGAGNIGQRLATKLDALNIAHFFCDPPLVRAGAKGDYRAMAQVANADIISLHVPIIREGQDRTEHLVDADFISALKPGTILINSCRGDVVDNKALLQQLATGKLLHVVMDVWQNEPEICKDLVAMVDIATPHIAGYSLEGKAGGTYMLYQKWCELSQTGVSKSLSQLLPPPSFSGVRCDAMPTFADISKLVRMIYDIRDDDDLCRAFGTTAQGFDDLRKQYGVRREFSALSLSADDLTLITKLQQLGFTGE